MGRPFIDTVGDRMRRNLLVPLLYAPSYAAIFVAGGWQAAAAAVAWTGALSLAKRHEEEPQLVDNIFRVPDYHVDMFSYKFRDLKRTCESLAEKFGMETAPKVSFMPGFNAVALLQKNEVVFGTDMVFTLTPPELEFAAAHEIAHLAAKDVQGGMFRRDQGLLATVGGFGAAVMTSGGITPTHLSVIVGLAAVQALLASQNLVHAYFSRSIERCCDHDAVQKTGDLEAAENIIERLSGDEPGLVSSLFHTHPVKKERLKNLRNAYEEGIKAGVIKPHVKEDKAPPSDPMAHYKINWDGAFKP